jgi:hypothetical protein
MFWMRAITPPIRSTVVARVCTIASARRASSTDSPAILDECATCVVISWIEIGSSSVVAATVWTLAEVCSAALATVID